MTIPKIIGIISIVLLVMLLLSLLIIYSFASGIKDIKKDYITEKGLQDVDCSELKNKTIDVFILCNNYYKENSKYHCTRNVISYYLERC